MQQSVIYQEIEQGGILKGEQSGEARLVLRLLTRRIGDMSPAMRSQIQSLSLFQIEALGEALLDFSSPSDLENWLQANH
jgi:predicted transposase YdaD